MITTRRKKIIKWKEINKFKRLCEDAAGVIEDAAGVIGNEDFLFPLMRIMDKNLISNFILVYSENCVRRHQAKYQTFITIIIAPFIKKMHSPYVLGPLSILGHKLHGDLVDHYPHFCRGYPRGVMVKAMDCGIVVREFVPQSRYYVHFRANTIGKGMNPLILPAMG